MCAWACAYICKVRRAQLSVMHKELAEVTPAGVGEDRNTGGGTSTVTLFPLYCRAYPVLNSDSLKNT